MNLLEMRLRAVERSARVLRYHTEPVVHRQSVGEHTYGVLWMLCLITDPSKELMKAGLMHDTAEYVAGDVPSPAKRHVTIKEAFDKVEEEVLAQLAWRLPDLTDEEERLLKLADLLEGAAFCLCEWRRGNRDIDTALGNYLRYLASMKPDGKAGEIFNYLKEQANAHGFQSE